MKDKNETKRDRFVRLAEARTNKIIALLRLLGNCSSRNVYEYTPEDVRKIFGAVEAAVADAKRRYAKTATGRDKFFTLG